MTTPNREQTFNLFEYFNIVGNNDAKRFEFHSKTNLLTSYTVGYHEADNITDAKIAVYKAIKRELETKHKKLNDFYQQLADTGLC